MIFLKQNYEVICIPLGALSREAKFKQDAKIESDCFKKNKKDIFKDVTRGGACMASLMKQNLNRSKNTKYLQREDGMGAYVYTYINTYMHACMHANP